MPDDQPISLDDWTRALGQIENEITLRIGATRSKVGALDVDEASGLEDLYKQKAHAEDMIVRLGGTSPSAFNAGAWNPPGSY